MVFKILYEETVLPQMKRRYIILGVSFLLSACMGKDYLSVEDADKLAVDSIRINLQTNPSSVIDDEIFYNSSIGIDDSPNSNSLINLELTKLFRIQSLSNNSTQGFAIYGNELFNCHHSNDYIDVYNLDSKDKTASIKLDPESIVHCNNVFFGSEFYNTGDRYPLLYIQQRGYVNMLNVYRIINDKENSLSARKVQVISFEPCSFSICAIDTVKNILYVIFGNNGKRYIGGLRLPSYKEGDLKINLRSAIKTYLFPFKKVGQDTAFHNNNLYLLCGSSGEAELWKINMDKGMAKVLDLASIGFLSEPEGIDIYDDNVLISFANRNVYGLIGIASSLQ